MSVISKLSKESKEHLLYHIEKIIDSYLEEQGEDYRYRDVIGITRVHN